MGMVKIFSPSGWNFDAPIASMIKMSRDGLRGNDRKSFIKRAGESSNIFLPQLDSIKIARDEVPVHLIALGALEAYGPNRNGDGFDEATCRDHHDTFTKLAYFYRNHKNKDPKKSYGIVKASAYNPKMRRIELLVALNAEKSAADRNGGLVADREVEKLARGDDLSVSMACRVPFDVCSWCKNAARTRDEYCKAASCEAGGCYDNLTKLVKVAGMMHHLHVRNPGAAWFDISDVGRPADQTAYGNIADWLTKAAADHGFMGVDGAKLAEDMGIVAPDAVLAYQAAGAADGLAYLVKFARGVEKAAWMREYMFDPNVARAFMPQMQLRTVVDPDGGEPGTEKFAAWLGALADNKIILPLREFAKLTKRAALLDAAAVRLSGVLSRMEQEGVLEARLARNVFAPNEKLASGSQRRMAERLRPEYALTKTAVDDRCMRSIVRGLPSPVLKTTFENRKQAADDVEAENLARDYACYKIAALHRIAEFDDEFLLTVRLSNCQNQVV